MKLEKYGKIFLEEIIEYCRQNSIRERKIAKKPPQLKESDTCRKTLELINQGLTLEEIAGKRGLAASTIASHIEKLILSGEEIDIGRFVSKERQETIFRCIRNLGTRSLTSIKERLGDDYSYNEIRLVRAILLKRL